MKPKVIDHVDQMTDYKRVVVEIDLTDEDKKMIHDLHVEYGGRDYNADNVSLLVFVNYEDKGNGNLYFGYLTQSYYPEEQGEMEIGNNRLPDGFEQECCNFVRANYIGHEDEYEVG